MMMGMFTILLVTIVSRVYIRVYMSKLIKLYTINVYSFSYVTYISIKKKGEKTHLASAIRRIELP